MKKLIVILGFLMLLVFTQDMFDETKAEIFTDLKVYPVGTIVKINFSKSLMTSYKSKLNRMVNKTSAVPNVTSEYFDFFPPFSATVAGNESGETAIETTKEMKGNLSGQIRNYNAQTKNYTINASHAVVINGKNENIQIAGQIASRKIKADFSVASEDMANVSIVFSGVFVSQKARSVKESDFNSLDFLTAATNANSLTPDTKKQLFIDYFNLILKELF